MKEHLRSFASHFVVKSGITALGRRLGNYDGAIILYGHRVADDNEGYLAGLKPEWLDGQLAYLTRHFNVMSLSVLLDSFEQGKPIPRRSVVLTFDDGFRDNYENAFPLLRKHKVPATIFLATGCVESGQLPWSQRLGCLFQQTSVPSLSHGLTEHRAMDLNSPQERKAAYQKVKEPLKHMGRVEREKTLSELETALETQAPMDRMMTWEMAREMMAAGMEMGAHTVSHPLLANLPESEARQEMLDSKIALQDRLGIQNPSFCFPAGSRNAALIERARELGFRSVFDSKTSKRINSLSTSSPFSLSRVGLPESPAIQLEAELDGPFHFLRKR
jgi:peptidoglycan/xylan/chitin deacetylase (PgdA/CDA1 family)